MIDLDSKRQELEKLFEEKKAAREMHLSQAASLLEELNKIQGAYGLLNELQVDPATTIDVEPTLKKQDKKGK